MLIKIFPFKGMFSRIGNKYLPDNAAGYAADCDLESGEIRALRAGTVETSIDPLWDAIHRWYDAGGTPYWLRFQGDVDVVHGPVADDVWERIYFTGDTRFTEPRVSYTGPIQTGGTDYPVTSYKMGVPAPSDPPTVAPYPIADITVSAIHRERPIRVETSTPHGYRTGDVVQFDITSAAPAGGESALSDLLNSSEYQVRVTSTTEFTLDYTDAANIDYSAFTAGTVKQYEDPGLVSSRYYVFTYVNDLGEEGPPSDPSNEIELVTGRKVAITLPGIGTDGAGRVIETVRVYRTATGNVTSEFRFVAEVPIATLTLDDELLDADLGEVLPSEAWDPPNADMIGLRVTAQGVGVGFFDNVLCFSEPYRLHAWPTDYQYAVADKVVSAEVVENGVIVTTTGRPYFVQGIDPRAMVPHRLPSNYACVSKQSMVSFGTAAVYACSEGLVMVAGGTARLVGEDYFVTWSNLAPSSIVAFAHEGRYIAFYDNGAGGKGGFMFDTRSPETGLVMLTQHARGGYLDPVSNTLYLLQDNGDIVAFDEGDRLEFTWQSKVFASRPMNLCSARVEADAYPITFNLYGDGVQRATITVNSDRQFALPSGFMCRDWQFEVQGEYGVQAIFVSDSFEEIL